MLHIPLQTAVFPDDEDSSCYCSYNNDHNRRDYSEMESCDLRNNRPWIVSMQTNREETDARKSSRQRTCWTFGAEVSFSKLSDCLDSRYDGKAKANSLKILYKITFSNIFEYWLNVNDFLAIRDVYFLVILPVKWRKGGTGVWLADRVSTRWLPSTVYNNQQYLILSRNNIISLNKKC